MITSIRFDRLQHLLASRGLPVSVPMNDLGRTVLLAGPNGAGKTRLLRVLQAVGEPIDFALTSLSLGNHDPEERLRHYLRREEEERLSGKDSRHARDMVGHLSVRTALRWTPDESVAPAIISLSLPRTTRMEDASQKTEEQRVKAVESCATPGLASAYASQHAYLSAAASHLLAADTPRGGADEKLSNFVAAARSLGAIIRVLLGTELKWTMGSGGQVVPELFDREFSHDELSEGQKILLAWAITLHRQRDQLRDAVLLLDEPENHLHPEACIAAIKQLSTAVLGEHGQIWLATHSIPLIASLGVDSLYAMRNGMVEYAGNRVCEVVDSLAGGVENREQLRAFLGDSERIGYMYFIAQCLAAPGVAQASADETDPQEMSFAAVVEQASAGRDILRILDFGAGRGRLADALARAFSGRLEVLQKLHYYAFDSDPEFVAERTMSATKLGSAGAKVEVLADLRRVQLEGAHVDLVVMCNVLHEIDPEHWLSTFKECKDALRDGGSLIVIEDQLPAIGELPHHKGFIVLDHIEMEALFGGAKSVSECRVYVPEVYRGRISVIQVPRDALSAASNETKDSALAMVQKRARREIENLRRKANAGGTQRSGRLHALYAMLWMNAELARH